MIASLRGEVVERDPDSGVVIEVSGVGYRVQVTTRTLAQMAVGSTVFVHTHHHIREDAQVLFGFVSRSEREAFGVLIATHGIGPALALAVLSTYTPAELSDVVAAGDIGGLTMVPGVGKKTAERLLVELRNRLAIAVIDSGEDSLGSGARTSVLSDVREALSGLGYGAEEIKEVIRSLTGADHGADHSADAATMLREALTLLGKHRA
jgi:holliday junction DNA helicase RuvA